MKLPAVVYPNTRRIGCPILQAMYGGSGTVPSLYFDPEFWAVAPPEEKPMLVEGTEAQWEGLAERWSTSPVTENAAR